ncbi:hypothetical protein Tco_0393269 [Tanacetum coccineum]
MNTTQAQQKAFDDALDAPTGHLEFEKCNMRLKTDIKPKEATFQVVLDALALTPVYQAFLITAEICPKIPGQEFEDLPLEQDILSFIRDLGHTRDITYLTDVNFDYLHQPWRAFSTVINKCLSGKETRMDKIRLSPDSVTSPKQKPVQATKGTRLKTKAKVAKSNKKKQLAKMPKAKGLDVLSKVALTKAEQLKLATKRSKKDFHISHASGSGDGVDTQSKVPDEQQQKTSGTDEGTGTKPGVPEPFKFALDKVNKIFCGADCDEEDDDEDDFEDDADNNDDDSDDNDESDDERTKSYKDEIPDPNKLMGGADSLKCAQQSGYEQEELLNLDNPSPADNEIASLMDTTTHHATKIPEITSSFTTTIPPPLPFFNPLSQQATPTLTPMDSKITKSLPALPDFASVFKFNERVSNLEKDLSEMKQVDQYAKALSSIPAIILPQAISDVATPVIEKNVTESLEDAVLTRSSSQPQSSYEADATLSEFELTKILIDKMEMNKSFDLVDYKIELYDALVKSYNIDKDIFESYSEVFSLKRSRDDKDKDQDPFAGLDRGTKRKKSSKEAEPSKDSRSKEKKSSSTSKDSSKSQHKSFEKSAHTKEPSHTIEDSGMQQDQEFFTGNNDEQPADKEVTKADWFKKPEQPPTPDPDWSKRQQVDF